MVRYSSRFLINKQKMFQFKIRLAEGPGLQILSWVSQTNIKRAVITGHGGGVLGQDWPELNQQWNAHFYGFVVASQGALSSPSMYLRLRFTDREEFSL